MSVSTSKTLNVNGPIQLDVDDFGEFFDKETNEKSTVLRYTWTNKINKTIVQVITYGATVTTIKVPDRHGDIDDVVLGYDTLERYITDRRNPYFGATVGRVCNRIAFGQFFIDGKKIQITKNFNNTHTLHGGLIGFDKKNWTPHVENVKVLMSHVSPDGHEGFPGTMLITASFELLPDNSFKINYSGTTTKSTAINLTNHSYFNLAGHGASYPEIYKHIITINADKITETDEMSIPSGQFKCVGGTVFDFRVPRNLGKMMERSPLIGYDDNFCVTQGTEQALTFIARAAHPETGRTLEVYSNQPGVQFYTSNFMPDPLNIITPADINTDYFYYDGFGTQKSTIKVVKDDLTGAGKVRNEEDDINGPIRGKTGARYFKHGAFCLETQKYPDAPNHENFPSIILKPGETYQHDIIYKFGVLLTDATECQDIE